MCKPLKSSLRIYYRFITESSFFLVGALLGFDRLIRMETAHGLTRWATLCSMGFE